jgi:acetolactate synthase-1/2/3 large subunit
MLAPDDVVLNEAIRNAPILQEHLPRTRPRSYVGLAGGGLGFSGGMALGLKLAQPHRRIVQVIGDGGFHFSSPDSVYAVAQQYQLPIFTVVVDNGGWQAVKSATQRVYPKGMAAETDQFLSRLTSGRQGERRDFSDVAKAFGAHGECVIEPEALAAAIDRCLAALDDGKAAVLHVHVTRL